VCKGGRSEREHGVPWSKGRSPGSADSNLKVATTHSAAAAAQGRWSREREGGVEVEREREREREREEGKGRKERW
jgi:hypothetical protein